MRQNSPTADMAASKKPSFEMPGSQRLREKRNLSHLRSQDVFDVDHKVNMESADRAMAIAPGLCAYSIGAPSDRLRRIHEIELAGLEAALGARTDLQ